MSRFWIVLLLTVSSTLAALVCDSPCEEREWVMTFSAGVGTLVEQQKFKQPAESLFYIKDVKADLYLKWAVAWEKLILQFSANYDWLLSGNLHFKGWGAPFPSTEAFSKFSLSSGYSIDLQPAIAVNIEFWRCGQTAFSFIPLLGYNYTHFNAIAEGQKTSGASSITTLSFTRPLQQDWFGPILEGRVAFFWKQQLRLDLFYQYIPFDFRQTLEQSVSNFILSSGALSTANTSTIRLSSKCDTTRVQLGGADLSFRSCDQWQLGLHFEGSSTWSNTARSIVRVKQNTFLPSVSASQTATSQKATIHWNRYLINCYGSYWF